MNCLEFKRLALSEPNSTEPNFIEHSAACPDCLKYVGSVRKMDRDLADSLNVEMPSDLVARLKLNQEISESESAAASRVPVRKYALAASIAVALFVAGFMASNQFGINSQIGDDYEALLAGVVEHMNEQPITPVWDPARANQSANTLLASYDGNMKMKYLANLQFTRICPMGQYKGLHATLDTPGGQVTFAYIKGEPVGELLNASYDQFVTRVKPVRGGNLIIMSRTQEGLQQADQQLEEAVYWEI